MEYQNKHYDVDQKDEGTSDNRRRDGGTKFILRNKEQETRLTLQEHDDNDDELIKYLFIIRTSRKITATIGLFEEGNV